MRAFVVTGTFVLSVLGAEAALTCAGVLLGETRGGDVTYDVVVRDLAGNVSATTSATAWAGCDGNCSSSGGAATWFAALLCLGTQRRWKLR